MIRHDRVGKEGGGIALYVKNNWSFKVLSSFSQIFDNNPEFIIVELKFRNLAILVSVVYRR